MTEKLRMMLKNGRITAILIAVCVLAVLLLAFFPEKQASAEDRDTETALPDAESYTRTLSETLTETVRAITGEPSPHIAVTLESMGETVYAAEDRRTEKNAEEYDGENVNRTQKDGDAERTYLVVRDADGGERALVVSRSTPEIRGVVVVSARGDEPVMRERITEAVRTMLNLSSTQVFVTGQT